MALLNIKKDDLTSNLHYTASAVLRPTIKQKRKILKRYQSPMFNSQKQLQNGTEIKR